MQCEGLHVADSEGSEREIVLFVLEPTRKIGKLVIAALGTAGCCRLGCRCGRALRTRVGRPAARVALAFPPTTEEYQLAW